MTWLVLACLLSFGFGQLFKWSQRRGEHGPTVATANYFTLAIAQGGYLAVRGELELSPPVVKLGALTGVAFIVTLTALTRALAAGGVGVVLTAFRVSILLPVVLGVWLWNEALQPSQVAGAALALLSMVLMTAGQRGDRDAPFSKRALALIALVFVAQGLSQIGVSSVKHMGLDGQRLSVLFVIALTAGSVGAGVVAFDRHRPTRGELAMGAGIGIFNLVNLVAILAALSVLPRSIFFPVSGCSVVILDNLCAHFYWKERLRPAAIAGAALGACSMLLIFPP